uniref:Putative secreted protein n=1 Tax=Anopheles darlingi TaxID=43151 RepID=A0A2M4DLR7_ANODA
MTRRVLWFITHLLIRIVDTDLGLYCTRGAHLTSRPLNSRQSEQQSGLMVARHAEQGETLVRMAATTLITSQR